MKKEGRSLLSSFVKRKSLGAFVGVDRRSGKGYGVETTDNKKQVGGGRGGFMLVCVVSL